MSDVMEKAWPRGIFIMFALGSLAPFLQAQVPPVEFANLREDVHLLTQRIQEMQLRIEQLEHDNQTLKAKAQGATQSYATVSQLNDAVTDLSKQIRTAVATGKSETLQQIGAQMDKLAKQTNAALESLAKNVNASRASASPVSSPVFSDDYPKEGVTYTVQKGDTLSVIAKKTGGSVKDIINANKLSDPSKIQYGQTLFIPGGK
ncbi:MAG TPA: LysM peptidoglycan-binding domain-containing protein [Opitutaceae bacterium]|nr:LysM peptidoglycan-binding domain-containing protein [Opitutaceae bacterium]